MTAPYNHRDLLAFMELITVITMSETDLFLSFFSFFPSLFFLGAMLVIAATFLYSYEWKPAGNSIIKV